MADATPQPGDEQAGEAAPAAVAQPDQQPDTQEITEPDVAEQSDAGLNEAGADLMPSGSTLEAQTDIVDDDAQATPAEGRMALFNDQEPVPQKISTEDYISGKVNLLRTYFTQVASGRLFLDHKNLLEWLVRDNSAAIAERAGLKGLDDHHRAALAVARQFLRVGSGILDSLVSPKDKYLGKDYAQFLLEDGKFPEQVKQAISFAALRWIGENGRDIFSGPLDSDIRSLLGLGDQEIITPDMRDLLGRNVTGRIAVINGMGRNIRKSLGISLRKGAPESEKAALEASLGNYALASLIKMGWVTQRAQVAFINGEEKRLALLSMATQDGDLLPELAATIGRVKAGNSILARLDEGKNYAKFPTFEPIGFNQKRIKNSKNGVPTAEAEILDKVSRRPWRMKVNSTWGVFRNLPEAVQLSIAGARKRNNFHVSQEQSWDAKNEGYRRSIEQLKEFQRMFEDAGLREDAAFYITPTVWKQQRSGFYQSAINPQADKLARELVAMDGWQYTVDLNDLNDPKTQYFYLAIGAGLGVKVGKAPAAKLVPKVLDMINGVSTTPAQEKAIAAITRALYGEVLPNNEAMAIAYGVADGGENAHSFTSLVEIARVRMAREQGKTSFDTEIMYEVDGVANGPMLGQLLFGAFPGSMDQYLEVLQKGGFFSGDMKNISEYLDQPGSFDLYQTVASTMTEEIGQFTDQETARAYSGLWAIVGEMLENGKVTSAARNLVKNPVTILNFGASLKNVLKNMAWDIEEALNTRIAEIALDNGLSLEAKQAEMNALINAVNRVLALPMRKRDGTLAKSAQIRVPQFKSADEIRRWDYTGGKSDFVRNAFHARLQKLFRDPLEIAAEKHFGKMIAIRAHMNTASNASFRLYEAIQKTVRDKFMQELADRDELPHGRQPKTGNIAGFYTSLHGDQQRELNKRIPRALTPVLDTAFSRVSGEIQNGISGVKMEFTKGGSMATQAETVFADTIAFTNEKGETKQVKSLTSFGETLSEVEPGVANPILSLHSSDSFVNQNAVADSPRLNMHDATGNGVGDVIESARKMNQMVLETALKHSIPLSFYEMLERQLMAVAQMVQDGTLTLQEAQDAFDQAFIAPDLGRDLPISPETFMKALKRDMDSAEWYKLEVMQKLTAINQYGAEGGYYELTDADREALAKNQEKLTGKLSPRLLKAFSDLGILVDPDTPNGLAQVTAFNKFPGEPQTAPEPQGEEGADAGELQIDPTADPELIQLFRNRPAMGAGEMLGFLAARFALDIPDEPIRSTFYGRLASSLKKALPHNLPIILGGENNPAFKKGGEAAFIMQDGNRFNGRIVLKGGQLGYARLNSETVLHEMSHAGTAYLLSRTDAQLKEAGIDPYRVANSRKTLEAIRSRLKDRIKANNYPMEEKRTLLAAVENIEELLAYGMTNPVVQRELAQIELSKDEVTSRSTLRQGLHQLLAAVLNVILPGYRGSDLNALTELTAHATELIETQAKLLEAQKAMGDEAPAQKSRSRVFNMAANTGGFTRMTTQDVLNQLDGTGTRNASHLETVLAKIVGTVHGPYGAFRQSVDTGIAYQGIDVFMDSLINNRLPLASDSLNYFSMSQQEAFVLEQTEAAVAASLRTSTVAYSELRKLYAEAKKRLSWENFLDAGVSAEVATQEQRQRAEERYRFVFKPGLDANNTSDYLSRFAALGLVYEPFRNALSFPSGLQNDDGRDVTFADRVASWFRMAMQVLAGKLTNTFAGQAGDQRLMSLVEQMVSHEARYRAVANAKQGKLRNALEMALDGSAGKIRQGIVAAAQTNAVKNSRFKPVRFAGSVATSTIKGQVPQVIQLIQKARNQRNANQLGFMSSLLDELSGGAPETVTLYDTLNLANANEQMREAVRSESSAAVMQSFKDNGQYLTDENKAALTRVGLRTNAQVLLGDYSIDQLAQLMKDPAKRRDAIKELVKQLKDQAPQLWDQYNRQLKDLAYWQDTGVVHDKQMMFNTFNIAKQFGRQAAGSVTDAQARRLRPLLDRLAAMYALEYSDPSDLNQVAEIIATESADVGSPTHGVQVLMETHRALQQEAETFLFDDNPVQMIQGYVKDITDPYTEMILVEENDVADAKERGWKVVKRVYPDADDPNGRPRFLMTQRTGGLAAHVTGAVSFTARGRRGQNMESRANQASGAVGGVPIYGQDLNRVKNSRTQQASLRKPDSENYDPRQNQERHAAPILAPNGEIAGYRYMMDLETRQDVLHLNDRMDSVIGNLAASVYDKNAAKDQNRKVVEALKQVYDDQFLDDPDAFMEVSLNSTDPDVRETYRLLPEEMKRDIADVFGDRNKLMVRKDVYRLMFGYRKLRLSDVFFEPEEARSARMQLFIESAEAVFGKDIGFKLRRGGDVWATLVTEVKDVWVIRNFFTLFGNITSNMTLLFWYGLGWKEMVKESREALKGIIEYQRDRRELLRLRRMQSIGYAYVDGVEGEIADRIIELEDAMARNPVKPLVDAGLYQTIVEDVDTSQDEYGYRARFANWADQKTAMLPSTVKKGARFMVMDRGTPLYQVMHRATHLSDFVGRYALYKHLTGPKNRVSHKEAVRTASRAFVNYSIPTHPALQWMNDVGIIPFTKYYLRSQAILFHLLAEKPARGLAVALLGAYLEGISTFYDSGIWNKFGNLTTMGALELPGAMDEPIPMKILAGAFQ